MRKYSYGKQSIDKNDIAEVVKVLKTDWLTQGPKVQEFEKNLGNKFGAKHVSAVSNGTAALHLAGLALGWKPGDVVITSPITFLASANCVLYSGATPDFVDIDEKYYTIDINKLEKKIKKYLKSRKKIKAVVAVDYAGQPCDWKGLRYLADKYEFQLVNDNCHALGAKYYGSEKYASKYADVVCQSYHPVKHITTGEGGSVLTNNKEIDERVKILRSHGMVKSNSEFRIRNYELEKDNEKLVISNYELKHKEQRTKHEEPNINHQSPNTNHQEAPWYYEMQMLGYNYRITDFQCALGISQLNKLDTFVEKRREIANFYDEAFKNDERFIIPSEMKNTKHSYHLYPLQINFNKIKRNKIQIFNELKNKGIICQVHYIPLHIQPYYRYNYGFKKGDYPIAEKFYEREISIPMYPSLNKVDLRIIVRKIKEVII
ncbi:MAG: UDP-4-amino-4,6-dideoxy-N-acetyl-beta-L-altrosamine transaminase [Ignavibacteriae bacterium]|nr:UDP-4-amino-4,6-dideoxy-N-acetyl-beta-L-altrosamine transaminase [Ignavibacteriota bacterium]